MTVGPACNLAALNPTERARRLELATQLRSWVEETAALPDGYAFRLTERPGVFLYAGEFLALERLCCPFLQFRLDVAAGAGPVWLQISGPPGVKEFLAAELEIVREVQERSPPSGP